MDMVNRFPNSARARLLRYLLVLPLFLGVLGVAQDLERIRILQTSDLHAAVDYEGADSPGVLKLASVVETLRAERDVAGMLHIDCGDTCQGSVAAVATRGEIGVRILKGLGVDIWVPGNHEFDFGSRQVLTYIEMMRPRVLCGNLEFVLDGQSTTFPTWRMVNVGRARVAVLGFTATYLPYWVSGAQIEGVQVRPALASLPETLAQMRQQQPDMVVLAMHQGWLEKDPRNVNEVAEIADRFPGIDLILGGHTHRPIPGRRIGLHTWYAQPGQRGQAVTVVDVTIDLNRHRVHDLESHLAMVEEETPESTAMAEVLASDLTRTADYVSQPVCELSTKISATGKPGIDCAMSELLCRALASATGAAIVFHGALSRESLAPGPISRGDLFQVVPYENEIVTAQLTQEEVNQILSEQWSQRNSYAYNGIWGIHAEIAEDGKACAEFPAGASDSSRITVAFNGYSAVSAGGRFPVLREILSRPKSMRVSTGVNTREALATYLKTHSHEAVRPEKWIRRVR